MQFELSRRFGVRVHDVDGLDEDLVYVPTQGLAFVNRDLDPHRRREVADWLLSEALLEELSSPAP